MKNLINFMLFITSIIILMGCQVKKNTQPVIGEIKISEEVPIEQIVELVAIATDEDRDSLSYNWEFTKKPDGCSSEIIFSNERGGRSK